MLELRAIQTKIIGCYGQSDALDRVAETNGLCFRVAETELLLIGERGEPQTLDSTSDALDSDGLVIDLSSAFSIWELRGDDRFEAHCRLSAIALPEAPGAVQGLVAHVPTKIVVREDRILYIAPATLSHHLRDRVRVACADRLDHRDGERAAAEERTADVGAPA